jgi:putative DNA primase/helicase
MCSMAARDWIAEEEVEAVLGEAARERGFNDDEIRDKFKRAVLDGKEKPHPDLDPRPVVRVKAGDLDVTATRAEEVLLGSGIQLFQRSGVLVRPVTTEVDATHGRRTKVAELVRLDSSYLRDLLCRVARWEKYDGRKGPGHSGLWTRIDRPPRRRPPSSRAMASGRFPRSPASLQHRRCAPMGRF